VINVSNNDTSHFTSATESQVRNSWKGKSSGDCRKLAGMVQMW